MYFSHFCRHKSNFKQILNTIIITIAQAKLFNNKTVYYRIIIKHKASHYTLKKFLPLPANTDIPFASPKPTYADFCMENKTTYCWPSRYCACNNPDSSPVRSYREDNLES